jgi:hypothetical protein
VDDCTRFLNPSESWAERAAQLGWNAMTLFGCAPRRPLDYSGSAGLLWAVNGGKLVELHRDWAVIDLPVHTRQRIFYGAMWIQPKSVCRGPADELRDARALQIWPLTELTGCPTPRVCA